MPKITRIPQVTAALAALALFPAGAHAATTAADGVVTGGSLTNTAPAIDSFGATLTGTNQTVHTAVHDWSVIDATGSNAGYNVTVAASAPTVDTQPGRAGTGFSMSLLTPMAIAADGNPAADGPASAQGSQELLPEGTTIATAAESAGQGRWDFPADVGGDKSLSVVIPADASAGAYHSTLTFTAAPPAN